MNKPSFQHILLATDFGDAADRAQDIATTLAMKFSAKLTILHVQSVTLPAYAQGLAFPTDRLRDEAEQALALTVKISRVRYDRVDSALAFGEAWEKILDVAKEQKADLIVVGTHGRRAVQRFLLGSVAERVARLSSVPVLTVQSQSTMTDGAAAKLAEKQR